MSKNATKEQIKLWNQKYYQKNKEKHYEKYNGWKKQLRVWYHELKATLKCAECDFCHPAALDFHHKDPATKKTEVSMMITQGLSKATILLEIAKCDVLCKNCHAIHHYNEKQSSNDRRQTNVGNTGSHTE